MRIFATQSVTKCANSFQDDLVKRLYKVDASIEGD